MAGRVWPAPRRLIDELLNADWAVYLASDHGHVEAEGVGVPNEGVVAETRAQRRASMKIGAWRRTRRHHLPRH